MLTITSKTTKADLAAEVERLNKEHEAFRKRAVKVALEAAEEHSLCGVVQETLRKAGLGDLLPAVYVIQEKLTSRSQWKDDQDFDPYDEADKDAALDNARQARLDMAGGKSEYFSYTIDLNTVNEAREKFEKVAKAVEDAGMRAYPQYRVVKRQGTDEVVATFGP